MEIDQTNIFQEISKINAIFLGIREIHMYLCSLNCVLTGRIGYVLGQ